MFSVYDLPVDVPCIRIGVENNRYSSCISYVKVKVFQNLVAVGVVGDRSPLYLGYSIQKHEPILLLLMSLTFLLIYCLVDRGRFSVTSQPVEGSNQQFCTS